MNPVKKIGIFNGARKTFFVSALFAVAAIASVAHAQGFVPLAGIPGLTESVTADEAGLANFLNDLYKYLIGLAAVIAVVEIIWGGLLYSTQDVPGSKTNGKEKIKNALLGLVLVLSPVLVFSIINPSILNLSINLDPLDTRSVTPSIGGRDGVSGTPTVDPTTQCSVSGISGILLIAKCPSVAAANTWGESCINGQLARDKKTDPSTGIVLSVRTCSWKKNYVFIDTTNTIWSAINALRPLVSTPTNPTNGSDAMSFASICRGANIGFQTCIDDSATFSFDVPCNLTGPNAATSWKCYDQKLICEDALTVNVFCTSSVKWTPFQ